MQPSSCDIFSGKSNYRFPNLHHKWEETIIPPNDEEQRKVRRTDAFLYRSGQDNVSHKRHGTGEHNVPSSITSAITVPRLEEHHEPPYHIGGNSQPLGIDGRKPKALDQL